MKQRVAQALLLELIENGGELRSGPVATLGVLRLAIDLRDAREELARLREQAAQSAGAGCSS